MSLEHLSLMTLLMTLVAAGLVIFLVFVARRNDSHQLVERLAGLGRDQGQIEKAVRAEIAGNRQESLREGHNLRLEIQKSLKDVSDSSVQSVGQLGALQKNQLEIVAGQLGKLTESNEKKLEALRGTVEQKLGQIQKDSTAKLEEMRKTVDERLQNTLEKRLGESFRLVSERLEQVYRGLGEMRNLAEGVGDLKRVLTNVKSRGMLGEVLVGNLLEQILAPGQYEKNVAVSADSNQRVEYAIKLPGPTDGEEVLLPIDSKFPKEPYERLVDAAEKADAEALDKAVWSWCEPLRCVPRISVIST